METARKRNAALTRNAILVSARQAFAERGYDGAGLRDIAAGAGVTAMLVNRYFGSKEHLFEEVLAAAMNAPAVLSQANVAGGDAPAILTRALVGATSGAPLDGFRMIVNSVSNPRAAEIIRIQILRYHHQLVTSAIPGDEAALRAALLLGLTAGVQLMRQMIALPALAKAEPDRLAALLEPLFRQLMEMPDAP